MFKLILSISLFALSLHAQAQSTKERLNNLEAQYPILEQRLVQFESQLAQFQRQLGNQGLMELMQTIQVYQTELQQLQGDVEQLRFELSGMTNRQKDLYLDIDRRLNDLAAASVPNVSSNNLATNTTPLNVTNPSVSVQSEPAANTANLQDNQANTVATNTAPPPVIKDAAQQRQAYEAAFNLLRDSRYPEAITAFDTFVKENPQSVYAANAQYWLGKLYYVTKNFESALVALTSVIQDYPNSSKEPDARLNLGYTYYELQDWQNARRILESVINKYPNSSAVQLAEQRLQALTAAGQ